MERIQAIPHILDEIASNLDAEDLATLARMSRAFFLAATAKLWWTIQKENLPTLLELMVQVEAGREPDLKRRDRLTRYRNCVRRVYRVLQKIKRLPADIRLLLSHSKPLFPLASIFSFDIASPTDLHVIEVMLTSSPLSISLRMDYSEVSSWCVFFQSLLREIVAMGGSLSKLMIVTPLSGPRYFDSWLPGLQVNVDNVFASLTRFTGPMGLVDVPLLLILSRAPRLEYVDIRRRKGDVLNWDILSLQALLDYDDSFRSVKTAILRCHISSLTSFMACIKGPLSDVQLKSEIRTHNEVQLLAVAMASVPSSVTKFLLLVDDLRDKTVDGTPGVFRFELMETLRRCSGMSEFELRWHPVNGVKFDLCDNHFARLAEAWPNLVSLKMKWAPSRGSLMPERMLCEPGLLTLASLVPLARHCSKLKRLHLDYMSAVVDFTKPFTLPVVPRPTLELRIDQSAHILNPTAVGSLMDSLWSEIKLQKDPYEWIFSSIWEHSCSLRTNPDQRLKHLLRNVAGRHLNAV